MGKQVFRRMPRKEKKEGRRVFVPPTIVPLICNNPPDIQGIISNFVVSVDGVFQSLFVYMEGGTPVDGEVRLVRKGHAQALKVPIVEGVSRLTGQYELLSGDLLQLVIPGFSEESDIGKVSATLTYQVGFESAQRMFIPGKEEQDA